MNKDEYEMDKRFKARCMKKLRALGLPTHGWYCETVEDTESPDAVFELCGCSRVRYVHQMSHLEVAQTIKVGCLCDAVMSGDELGAVNREREAHNRAKRKQNFIHGQWHYEAIAPGKGCWKKKMRNGPVCRICKNDENHYGVWHKDRWCFKCRGKPMTSFSQAANALFTVNDPKRRDS